MSVKQKKSKSQKEIKPPRKYKYFQKKKEKEDSPPVYYANAGIDPPLRILDVDLPVADPAAIENTPDYHRRNDVLFWNITWITIEHSLFTFYHYIIKTYI